MKTRRLVCPKQRKCSLVARSAACEYETIRAMGLKQVHMLVRGRVQGVFFRASTQREAKRLGLTGWVKNRPDGSVEIAAEGEEEALKDLIVWAQKGPTAARVENVDVRWRGFAGEFPDFRIVE